MRRLCILIVGCSVGFVGPRLWAVENARVNEPNIEEALSWWPAPRNVWTPLGWKSHLFRFQVAYNGTLLCTPAGWLDKPHVHKYIGKNFQLGFYPSVDGTLPPMPEENT